MTDEIMNLRTLLETSSDGDLLREMIGFTAQLLWSRRSRARPAPPTGKRALSGLSSATVTATGCGRRGLGR